MDAHRLELLRPEANAGYGAAPIPSDRDREIKDVLAGALAAGEATELRRRIEVGHHSVLLCFAERAATLAVRERDPEGLRAALVALCLGGLADGSREALLVMAVVHHAAGVLGVDRTKLYAEVGESLGADAAEALAAFLRRPPEDSSLEAMGYRFVLAPDGPRYERTW